MPHMSKIATAIHLSNKDTRLKDCVEIGVDAEDYYRIKGSGKDRK